MPYKDPEKKKEHGIMYRRKKLGQKPNEFHDFETHRGLAMSSGIRTQMEWYECHKMGLFPDGIYSNPDQAFSRKYRWRK